MAINREKVSASAIKLLQAGKYEKASSEFARLVQDDPKDVRSLLKLGDCHVKLGRKSDAVAAYQRVAAVYSEQGFYLKAVAVFKQMLRVDANLPDVHLQLAEMYQQLGLLSDCLQHFQQVAVHYEREGRTDQTLEILKRMVDLDPDNLPSRIKLAELFAQQNRNGEAVQEFHRAAVYLKEHDRMDDYVRVAERLVYFDPSAIEVTRELSEVYLARGDFKLALGKLQTCFKADPRNLGTLALIAEAFRGMDQLPKTISVFKEMARIYETQNDVAAARDAWEKALALSPNDAEAQHALGVAPTPAAPAAPAAAEPPPPPPPEVDPIAEQVARLLTETDVYVKYGLKEKALEHLQKVFGLVPDHIDAHDRLRDLHQQMGNRAGLVAELRTLVNLGAAVQDARTAAWQNDLEALTQSTPPSAAPAPEAMVLDEGTGGILIDPAVPDEIVSAVPELPPDEDLADDPMAMLPGDSSFDMGLPGDDGEASVSDEAILSNEAVLPADDLLLDDAMDAASDALEAYTLNDDSVLGAQRPGPSAPPIPDSADDEPLVLETPEDDVLELTAPTPNVPPVPAEPDDVAFAASPTTGFDVGDDSLDDELAAAASAAVEALAASDMDNMFGDAFGSASGEGAAVAPEGEGFGGDGNVVNEFAQAFEAQAPDDVLPEGFEAPDLPAGSQMPESYGATEIMSLSPTDIQEMRAFVDNDPPAQPPSEFDDGDNDNDSGFGEATVAMPLALDPQGDTPQPLSPEEEREADAILAAEAQAFEGGDSFGNEPAHEAFKSDEEEESEIEIPQSLDDLGFENEAAGFDFDDSDLADIDDLDDDALLGGEDPFAGMSDDDLGSAVDDAAESISDEGSALDGDIEPDAPPPDPYADALQDDAALLAPEPAPFEVPDAPVADPDDAPVEDTQERGRRLGVADAAHGFENDPAAAFFPDELDEAEFFIKQGIIDEAAEILEEIEESLPEPSPRVVHMKARIAAIEAGEPEPPAPWEQGIIDSVQEELKDLDLEAWGGEVSGVVEQISVDEVLSQFKEGVKNAVDENDAETHYNLGIAYREMGLLADAVSEFEIAARVPQMAPDALHLIGLTRLDQGDYEGALKSLDEALGHNGQADGQRAAHEFERGRAFEGMGQPDAAQMAYQEAQRLGSENADIKTALARVAALVGDAGIGHLAASDDAPRKKNIDYL